MTSTARTIAIAVVVGVVSSTLSGILVALLLERRREALALKSPSA